MLREAFWIACPVKLFRLGKRSADIDIGGTGRCHLLSSATVS
jgi:hypothetical protein